MRLGIDLDDVLADFIPVFRRLSQELYGKPDDDLWPSDWAWSNFNLSPVEKANLWTLIGLTPNFFFNLPPCKDTEFLPALAKAHQLFFVSARLPGAGEPPDVQSAKWLEKHYGLDHPCVILAKDKAAIIDALDIQAFIDDRAETCNTLYEEVPLCETVLLARPHNTTCHPTVKRVKTFNEFAQLYL